MKKHLLIALLSIILCSIKYEANAQLPFGVNLAGAEFGTNFPGTYNVDYTYPTSVQLDYYQANGLNLIRLPIKWERIQPVLNGNLNEAELGRIKNFLLLAQNRNMNVIIDLHNYCRYNINGTERIIGSTDVSIANIKNLWTKLALALNTETNIWAYGIMNEPHDLLANATWFDTAQEIINGIRINDVNTNILVAGDSWSSAERWMQYSNNLKNLSDPANKLIFEAHVYFDKDASGIYANTYDMEGAYPNIGVDRVTPFVNWLKINNLKGFIGEYGVPANDSRWLVVLNNFLSFIKANGINGTYWAGGPWWGNYIVSLEPVLGVAKPQMNILLDHLNTNPTSIFNKLVWNDEFDGYGLVNSANWFHQTQLPNGLSWYNSELQHYTNSASNSFRKNGILNIIAKRENFTDQGQTKQFTSARLNSKFAFKYGRVEVRAKLPTGAGTWPAIWMLGKNIIEPGAYWTNNYGTINWPACGEIDIMEHWGSNQNVISSAVHHPIDGNLSVGEYITNAQNKPNVSTEFNIYGLEWDEQSITFSVNGINHLTYNPIIKNQYTWPFDAEQYLLLNIAIEPRVSSNFVQSTMEIDYVRVYQKNVLNITNQTNTPIFNLYPNPVTDKLTIARKENTKATAEIHSILGQKLYACELKEENTTIDLADFQSGIYFVSIISESGTKTYKVVKK